MRLFLHESILQKLAVFFLIWSVTGCSKPLPEIAVNSEFAGQRLKTYVDSEIAKYYLENYLKNLKTQKNYDAQIDQLYKQYTFKLPSRENLQVISNAFSVDFAALFFADKLLSIQQNKLAQELFTLKLREIKQKEKQVFNKNYLLLFVPGWDYQDSAQITGADFAVAREQVGLLGLENYLIHIPSNGGVEGNARYISKAVEAFSHKDKPIILIGASSANPAIHLALSELLNNRQQQTVKAWINVGGILQGSPIVDYYLQPPLGWFLGLYCDYRGWKKQELMSMSMQQRRQKFESLKLPEHLLIFNYMGLPMSGQVSYLAKERYLMLKEQGPNDGLTFLTDMIAPNSITIIAPGSDHFFAQDPEIHLKTIALTQLVIQYLTGKP